MCFYTEPCQAWSPWGASQGCSVWSRCDSLFKFTYSGIRRCSVEPHCVLQVPQYLWSNAEGKPTVSHLSDCVVETETCLIYIIPGYQEQMSLGQLWEKPAFKWELYLIFAVFFSICGEIPSVAFGDFCDRTQIFKTCQQWEQELMGHVHEVNLHSPFSTSGGSTSTGATHSRSEMILNNESVWLTSSLLMFFSLPMLPLQ